MKIYWSNNSVPELRDLSRKQQESLLREARGRVLSVKGLFKGLAFIFGSFSLAIVLVCVIPFFDNHDLLATIVIYSVAPVVVSVVLHFNMAACRPILREIRERDYGEDWSKDSSAAPE